MVSVKGAHVGMTISLPWVRWSLTYSLSGRQLEERMQGAEVSSWLMRRSPAWS